MLGKNSLLISKFQNILKEYSDENWAFSEKNAHMKN